MPLDGVRILDFTWVVAGPVATRILADHGAEVVKVERKDPPPIGNRKRGLQCDLHRDKLSVALNMQHPRGVELARKLAAMSDLVMDNFSARVMRTWGMDYESLSAVKPDIICISMSGLGHTGPRSSYVSYGPTLQALTGYTQLMAEPDGTPAGYGYSYADMCGGYTGRARGAGRAVASAAHRAGPVRRSVAVRGGRERGRSGAARHRGQRARAVAARLQFAGRSRRAARRLQMRALDGDDDRWVAISVAHRPEWRRLVTAIGSPEWASDPKFRTLYLRMQNSAELDANISRWTAEHSAEDAMTMLQRAGIAAGVVENGVDICARDPQLKERGFWPAVSTKMARRRTSPESRSSFPAAQEKLRTIAPEVGEDFDYVLGELLGLGKTERDELVAAGAVWP